MKTQLLLNLEIDIAYKSENYIIGKPNKDAFDYIIQKNAQWEGNCCLLTGDKGSGKSFLARLWKEKSHAQEINAIELHIDACDLKRNILIEDLTYDTSEADLFHILNFTKQNSKNILLTSADMGIINRFSLKDLTSRLRQSKHVTLEHPDDKLLIQLFSKAFVNHQVNIDIEPIKYLLTKIERNYHNIEKIVTYINETSLREKRTITKKFISAQLDYIINNLDAN